MEYRKARAAASATSPRSDRADGGDRHQGADADLALGQPPQRAGHERPGPQGQRDGVQPGHKGPRGVGEVRNEAGQQEESGGRGEPQFADLPQPFGLALVHLALVVAGLVVAAAARRTHRDSLAAVEVP